MQYVFKFINKCIFMEIIKNQITKIRHNSGNLNSQLSTSSKPLVFLLKCRYLRFFFDESNSENLKIANHK